MATRGYGNSGEISQQSNSTENNPRGNREESRSSSESRESRAMGEGSQGLGEGSENITQLRNAEAYTTATEKGRLYELTKENSTLKYLLNSFVIKDSLKGVENAKNNLQLINNIKTLDKTLTKFKKAFPNESKNDELIKIAEKKLAPLKEKYLSKENTHKDKSKSNDDFGIGM